VFPPNLWTTDGTPPVADKGSICWRSGRFCAALQAALTKSGTARGQGWHFFIEKMTGGVFYNLM